MDGSVLPVRRPISVSGFLAFKASPIPESVPPVPTPEQKPVSPASLRDDLRAVTLAELRIVRFVNCWGI
jgi:hypothetical protein